MAAYPDNWISYNQYREALLTTHLFYLALKMNKEAGLFDTLADKTRLCLPGRQGSFGGLPLPQGALSNAQDSPLFRIFFLPKSFGCFTK